VGITYLMSTGRVPSLIMNAARRTAHIYAVFIMLITYNKTSMYMYSTRPPSMNKYICICTVCMFMIPYSSYVMLASIQACSCICKCYLILDLRLSRRALIKPRKPDCSNNHPISRVNFFTNHLSFALSSFF